jgi:hypothetical protein
VGRRGVAEPQTPEERHKMVAASPFVALEGALADPVAGRVGEPTVDVLADPQPPGSENSIPLAWSARAWNLLLLASSAVAP